MWNYTLLIILEKENPVFLSFKVHDSTMILNFNIFLNIYIRQIIIFINLFYIKIEYKIWLTEFGIYIQKMVGGNFVEKSGDKEIYMHEFV